MTLTVYDEPTASLELDLLARLCILGLESASPIALIRDLDGPDLADASAAATVAGVDKGHAVALPGCVGRRFPFESHLKMEGKINIQRKFEYLLLVSSC